MSSSLGWAVWLVVLYAAQVTRAGLVFDAFRLLQYEDGRGVGQGLLGSQRANANLLAASARDADVTRRMAVARVADVNKVFVDSLVGRKIGGLIVLLPTDESSLSEDTVAQWREYEAELIKERFEIPIYFTFEDDNATAFYNSLEATSGTEKKSYNLVVSATEGSAIKTTSVTNIQGWLGGVGNIAEGSLPTIALVAHYDALAAAPQLAFGLDSSASGVVAVLEIARLFSKLYRANGFREQGKYNLLFALVGGGRVNYAGTKNFLTSTDARILETIEFALCLDSLGSMAPEDPLHLHVSKLRKEGPVSELYEIFTETAKAMNIPLEFGRRKINISSSDMQWHHERFSRKRIVAATLSRHAASAPWLERPDIFDNRALLNVTVLKRNIKFIAESIAKHIYGLEGNVEVFDGSFMVDEHHIEQWLSLLARTPRMPAEVAKDSAVVAAFEKSFATYTNEASVHTYKVDTGLTFYTSSTAVVSAYVVGSMQVDFIFLACNLCFLSGLYVSLQGWGAVTRLMVSLGLQSKKRR